MRAFRIISLPVMFPDLGVILRRHCLSRVQIENMVGFWGTPRLDSEWVSCAVPQRSFQQQ